MPAGPRTGEVAERAGVDIQTPRYYERRGLVAEPVRSNGGHRLCPPGTVADCPVPFPAVANNEA